MNSQNSAINENNKVLDSIQGHITKLQSAFEQFSTSLINSDMIKFFIDAGTAMLDFANSGIGQLTIKLGALIVVIKAFQGAYQKGFDLLLKKYPEAIKQLIVNLASLKMSFVAAGGGIKGFGASLATLLPIMKSFIITLASNPVTWIVGAIAGFKLLGNLIESSEKKIQKLQEKYKKLNEEIKNNETQIASINTE